MRRKRRRKRFPKEEAIKLHADKRFSQRFGWIPTKQDYQNMVRMIREGKAEFISRSSLRVSMFRLQYNGDDFTAIYDKKRKLIVTVYEYSIPE